MRKMFLLPAFLLLTSCAVFKSEVELKGNVFIVTNGAQNVKLGLVEVRTIPEGDFKKFLDKKNASFASERERLKQEADQWAAEYSRLKAEYDRESDRYSIL